MEKRKLNFEASYSNISKYIDSLYDGFIPNVYGRVRTLDHVNVIPDVKYTKVIPTVSETEGTFVSAAACSSFSNGATTSVTGVTLTAVYLKKEESFCLNEMEQYYFGQYMKRGSDQEDLPFEQAFIQNKMNVIAKRLDTMYWQGDPSVSLTGEIAAAVAGGAISLTASTLGTGATAFGISTAVTNGVISTFDAMIDALDASVLDEEDLVLFVGRDVFDRYTRSIRNLNFYHCSPDEIRNGVTPLFGKNNVKLVATAGLNGTYKALLGKGEWIFFGTDMRPDGPDDEPIKGEYSMYYDKYLMRYKVKMATGIAFGTKFVVINL